MLLWEWGVTRKVIGGKETDIDTYKGLIFDPADSSSMPLLIMSFARQEPVSIPSHADRVSLGQGRVGTGCLAFSVIMIRFPEKWVEGKSGFQKV